MVFTDSFLGGAALSRNNPCRVPSPGRKLARRAAIPWATTDADPDALPPDEKGRESHMAAAKMRKRHSGTFGEFPVG